MGQTSLRRDARGSETTARRRAGSGGGHTSRSEEALRASEERHRSLIEQAPDGILVADLDGIYTEANAAACRLLGRSLGEIVGSSVVDALAPEDADRLGEAREALSRGAVHVDEWTLRRKDGSYLPVEISAKILSDGRWLAIVRDISQRARSRSRRAGPHVQRASAEPSAADPVTDHRRIEDQLRLLAELEAALMIAAPSYEATLAEVARLVVRDFADWFVVDIIDDDRPKRLKVECSDPAKRALAAALEAIPQDQEAPDLLTGALRERRATLVTDVDSNDAEPEVELPTHLTWLRALGVRSLITAPIVSHDRLLGAFALLSSREGRKYGPTDLRFAEELGRVAALALENAERYRTTQRAIAARDDVMGIVAHDLRNPLNAVLLQSEILRRSGAPSERSSDSPTTAIRRSVQQMNRLIQDMLDVARLEGGTLAVDRRPLPARSLLDDVQIMQREAAEAAELRVRIDAPEDLPEIFADRGRMFQVFGNLIGNAIKFMGSGGEIVLGAKAGAGEVLFWAADTGPGVPPEQLPHLFDRFWQAKKTDRRGAGLGLSIVKGIITAHGGRIWVESRLSEGTTFYFTVPVAAPPEPEAPAASR